MFPFAKTFSSLTKAKLSGIIILCALLSVVVVGAIVIAVTSLSVYFTNFDSAWLSKLVNLGAGIISVVAGWFMLPAFMVLFAGLFQEQTINRVEKAFYPESLRAESPGFWPDMMHDIRFTAKALILNILIIPLYFMGVGFIISIILNSYLLGREFFESAAGYHHGKPEARKLGRGNKVAVYSGGFVIVLMTLTPVLNIIMPILATVWMVHVYHGLTDK